MQRWSIFVSARHAGIVVAALAILQAPAGGAAPPFPAPRPTDLAPHPDVGEICRLIGESAERHALPRAFLARLIWRESRFDARAVSPVGAEGIAQFMPATAAERGLENPWSPAEAIPASAAFLADLRGQFGNLGLAAAAYNAGAARVERWLARGGRLPWETVSYVHAITAHPVEDFRAGKHRLEPRPLAEAKSFEAACRELPVVPTRATPRPPWGVQVASGVSHGAARAAWSRIEARHPGVLRGTRAMILRSGLRVGARYVARIGAPSRAAAGRLCKRLRRDGGNCVVIRN